MAMPIKLDRHTGERLLELRAHMGLSQRELAKELGVTSGAIAHWEAGTHPVPGPVVHLVDLYEEELSGGDATGWAEVPMGAFARAVSTVQAAYLSLRGLFELGDLSTAG